MLLDELDFPGFGVPDRRGPIVVEIKEPHTLEMLRCGLHCLLTPGLLWQLPSAVELPRAAKAALGVAC